MKRIMTLFAVLALCQMAGAASIKTETIVDQGITRTFYLYLPDDLPDDAPLVFVLHGYGGSADGYQPAFTSLADEYGMAVCYPQATVDPKNKNGWNVYYPWQIDKMQVDDCEFICALARHLQATYGLSARNTFFCGMSNGGEMCYLMAYRKPKEFAAIASMAGLTLVEMARRHT